jgi:hypothetical protein
MNKTSSRKRLFQKKTPHLLYLREDKGQISLDFIAGTVIFMVTFMFLFQTLTSLFVPFVSNSDEIKSMADRVAMTLAESTNGLADSPTENNIISVKRAEELNDQMNTTSGYNDVLEDLGLSSDNTKYNLNLSLRETNGSIYQYQGNVVLNNGPVSPVTANVAQTSRIVYIKQETNITNAITILYVRVW